VEGYVSTWEGRCYKDGIPDEVSRSLQLSHRVPSYKAVAMAILKNDLKLTTLGFSTKHSMWSDVLKAEKKKKEENQLNLF
jgi:predicted phosphoadenosine phosphosulfate sulfurtransferase